MKEITSQCIVCNVEFPVSQITKRIVSKNCKKKFRVFCSYLNIPISQGENDQEICLWNSSCDSFSFCLDCKMSINKLYKLHEQNIFIKRDLRKIVASFVKKVITTETINNTTTTTNLKLGSKNEDSENNLTEDKENSIVENTNNSKQGQKKLIVHQIVADRIKGIKETIKKHYNPNIILTDCKDQLKDKAPVVVEIESDLDLSKNLQDSTLPVTPSSSHQNKNIENNKDNQGQTSGGGGTTKESSLNEEKIEEINNVSIRDESQLKFSGLRTSTRKRSQSSKLSASELWDDDQEDDDDDDKMNQDGMMGNAPTSSSEMSKTFKKKPKVENNIGSKLFNLVTVEPDIYEYGQWKIEQVVKGKKFKCQACGHTNTRRSAVIKHINTVHVLNIEGYSRSAMDEDGIYHYKEWSFKETEAGFKCLHCGRIRKHKHSLINHINDIHNQSKLRLTCAKCRLTWNTEEGLKQHNCCPKEKPRKVKNVYLGDGKYTYDSWMYTKLDGVGYQCGTCEAVKSSIDRISAHIRERHIDPNKYICDQCGYTAGSPSLMKQHQASHSDVKNVVCDICGKKFATMGRLGAHKIGHRAERFHCNVCNKSFQYQNGLGRHRRLTGHIMKTRSINYVSHECPKCDKDLRNAKRLEKHMLKCIGKKENPPPQFACTVCRDVILDEKSLWTHMASVHDIVQGNHNEPQVVNNESDGEVIMDQREEDADADVATEEQADRNEDKKPIEMMEQKDTVQVLLEAAGPSQLP